MFHVIKKFRGNLKKINMIIYIVCKYDYIYLLYNNGKKMNFF